MRKSLSDIVDAGGATRLRQNWQRTEAAGDLEPVPKGAYVAHVVAGELLTSKKNSTPGYQLTFRVCEGDFAGRQLWHTCWLSEAALPMAKRDLAKLGVTELDQLEQPLPEGIRVELHVVVHADDEGEKRNKIKRFAVVGIDAPEPNPFAPTDGTASVNAETPSPDANGNADFSFGHNAVKEPEAATCTN